MRIHSFYLGPLETNCYLLAKGGEAVAVDPGGNPAAVVHYLTSNDLALAAIVNTHLHFDHVLGNAELAAATGAPIYANALDDFLVEPDQAGPRFGLPPTPPFEHRNLGEGDLPLLGGVCKVLHTPGHTPGSLSFYFPGAKALFAGDVLFYRSVGRTDLPGGNAQALRDAIQSKLFALPPETVVYPGHGPTTSIGDEIHGNPFVGL